MGTMKGRSFVAEYSLNSVARQPSTNTCLHVLGSAKAREEFVPINELVVWVVEAWDMLCWHNAACWRYLLALQAGAASVRTHMKTVGRTKVAGTDWMPSVDEAQNHHSQNNTKKFQTPPNRNS